LISFSLYPNVMWHEGRWRCECGYVSTQWVATLYFNDIVMAQCTDSSLLTALRSMDGWRQSVTRSQAVMPPKDERTPEENRRQNAPERRAVPRGGRRSRDPRH
jgi:hypothetical protein